MYVTTSAPSSSLTPYGRLRRDSNDPQVLIPPLRNVDWSWAKSDDEKVDICGSSATGVYTPPLPKSY